MLRVTKRTRRQDSRLQSQVLSAASMPIWACPMHSSNTQHPWRDLVAWRQEPEAVWGALGISSGIQQPGQKGAGVMPSCSVCNPLRHLKGHRTAVSRCVDPLNLSRAMMLHLCFWRFSTVKKQTAGICEGIITSTCTSFLKLRGGSIQNGAVQWMSIFKLRCLFRSVIPCFQKASFPWHPARVKCSSTCCTRPSFGDPHLAGAGYFSGSSSILVSLRTAKISSVFVCPLHSSFRWTRKKWSQQNPMMRTTVGVWEEHSPHLQKDNYLAIL